MQNATSSYAGLDIDIVMAKARAERSKAFADLFKAAFRALFGGASTKTTDAKDNQPVGPGHASLAG